MLRKEVIAKLVDNILMAKQAGTMVVAVTGITASGKSTLANEICDGLAAKGCDAFRATIDDFHHPLASRYASKKESWLAYFEDAHNYEAMVERLLAPLNQKGDKYYINGSLDLAKDIPIDPAPQKADDSTFCIVDGTFLLKPQLDKYWTYRVYVKTDFEIARRRGVERDFEFLGGRAAAEKRFIERYHKASKHYLDSVKPEEKANAVVINDDVDNPGLVLATTPRENPL